MTVERRGMPAVFDGPPPSRGVTGRATARRDARLAPRALALQSQPVGRSVDDEHYDKGLLSPECL